MSENVVWHQSFATPEDRRRITGGEGLTVWMTGLSGSGKSTIGHLAERLLLERGRATYVLDADNLRHGLNSDLGFSTEDRVENVRRVGEVARLMADAGIVTLVAIISPFAADRKLVRDLHGEAGIHFIEVFVDATLEVCEQRDPKGLYARARAGEISEMTGIDSPYEAPDAPGLRLDSASGSAQDLAVELVELITNVSWSRR
ncbi:MAG: adenylyl-sulfate kinase [Acidimicrobiia bacterium]